MPRSGPSLEAPSLEPTGFEREWEAQPLQSGRRGLELHPGEQGIVRSADPGAGGTEGEERGPEGAGPEPGKG